MSNMFFDSKWDFCLSQNVPFPFFTKNQTLLNEYKNVKLECYREIKGLPEVFDTNEHSYDAHSDTLLVTYEDIVIGGGRIVGKFPNSSNSIPMDSDEFSIEDVFSEFDLQNVPYCEFTRLAVVKNYRSKELLNYIFTEMVSFSIAKGYRYLFSVSSLPQARCNRMAAQAIGLPFKYVIHKDLKVPDQSEKYGELKVCVSSIELPKQWLGIKNRNS